jgi:hypothetical protein
MAFSPVAGQDLGVDVLRLPANLAAPFSLLSVSLPLPVVDGDRVRSRDGLPVNKAVRLDHTNRVLTATWENCPDPEDVKEVEQQASSLTFHPFTWYSEIECDGAPGDIARWIDLTAADVKAAAAWQMSHELQTGEVNAGTVTASPSLNAVADVVGLAGDVSLVAGLGAALEAFHKATHAGGQAVIHLPHRLVPAARDANLITTTGATLTGPSGEAVSVGPGYDSTVGPDGTTTADDESWIYVTGPIFTAVGNPFDPASPSAGAAFAQGHHAPRLNLDVVIAELRGIYAFDPDVVFAARVTAPALEPA